MWDTLFVALAIGGYLAFVVSLSVHSQRVLERKRR
jgi:hypothetical protein